MEWTSIGRRAVVALALAAWGGVAAQVAGAQTVVCGDADGSGTVTVTDGVQVLRAAAGLASTCSDHASACDVDGNGSVTVSDGVNVLRKAAGLSITEACPTSGVEADVATISGTVVPFLTVGLSQVPSFGLSSSSAVVPADTQNCEEGGSRTSSNAGIMAQVTFAACRITRANLGSFQFDGTVTVTFGIPDSTVAFELRVTDLSNNKVSDFDGTLDGTVNLGSSGGFVVDGGPISVRSSEHGPEIFSITFHDLTVDKNAKLVSGSATATDTSDSFELKTATFMVVSSTTADLHVVHDDSSTADFTLNLDTGELSPAS